MKLEERSAYGGRRRGVLGYSPLPLWSTLLLHTIARLPVELVVGVIHVVVLPPHLAIVIHVVQLPIV